MTPLLIAGGYSVLLGLVLAFNRGAHRKPSPRPHQRPLPPVAADAGNVVTVFVDYTPMESFSGEAVDADLTWEGEA